MNSVQNFSARYSNHVLSTLFRKLVGSPSVGRSVAALLACGLLVKSSSLLSELSYNNFSEKTPWNWEHEIVLITGGSSGIGELVARKLAGRNIAVVVFDINPPKSEFPPNVFFLKVDITSRESVKTAADAVRHQLGHPTVLINNAGIGYSHTVFTATEDEVRNLFDVNTIAHFTMVQEFVPRMMEIDHGHVVTVASTASFLTIAGTVAYSCSKASALAFHEGLRQELLHRYNINHVRTSIIHPAFVRTRMTRHFQDRIIGGEMLDIDHVADRIVEHVLKGRSGQIVLPAGMWMAPLVRGLPVWFREWIQGSRSMIVPS